MQTMKLIVADIQPKPNDDNYVIVFYVGGALDYIKKENANAFYEGQTIVVDEDYNILSM